MRKALFSLCKKYRYTLWRGANLGVDREKYVNFIGLNPSTADEVFDDPTIRRCVRFARDWGYGSMCMTNLFAYRATDYKAMLACKNPIGPGNDYWLTSIIAGASLVIAAWGTHGKHLGRDKEVSNMIPSMRCLGLNRDGSPKHPLYLKASLTPVFYFPKGSII